VQSPSDGLRLSRRPHAPSTARAHSLEELSEGVNGPFAPVAAALAGRSPTTRAAPANRRPAAACNHPSGPDGRAYGARFPRERRRPGIVPQETTSLRRGTGARGRGVSGGDGRGVTYCARLGCGARSWRRAAPGVFSTCAPGTAALPFPRAGAPPHKLGLP